MSWLKTFVIGVVLCFAGSASAELPNPFYAMDTISNRGKEPLDQKLDDLKTLGYAGLSWTGTDVAQIKTAVAAAEQRGLKIFANYVGLNLEKSKLSIPANIDDVFAALGKHGTVVWLYIPSKDHKLSDPAGDEIAVLALQDLSARAAKHNVKLALYPHAGFWAQSFPDCLRLAKKVDRPNFGVSFNLCHVLKTGDETHVLDLLREAKPWLFMVTLNGADADSMKAGWDRLIQPVGRGTYNLEPMLKQLKTDGYTGPIGFQGYGIAGDRMDIMRQTMDGWKKLIAGL